MNKVDSKLKQLLVKNFNNKSIFKGDTGAAIDAIFRRVETLLPNSGYSRIDDVEVDYEGDGDIIITSACVCVTDELRSFGVVPKIELSIDEINEGSFLIRCWLNLWINGECDYNRDIDIFRSYWNDESKCLESDDTEFESSDSF